MQRIRFIRDTVPEREGGPGYKLGDEVELPLNLCERWRSRNAAEYVTLIEKEEKKTEESNGDTMEGSAHVDGQDGGDSGQRTEPEPAADKKGAGGKSAKHRS